MTISSQTRKAGPYSGTGSTGPFSFSFKVFEASDLLVVNVNNTTNVETTLVLTTDYTVSLNADQNSNPGGTVTLVAALASGYSMVISSQVPYLQETDLTNQGGFYPDVIEDALDKLTIETQQLKEAVDRSVKLPITNTTDVDNLTNAVLAVAADLTNVDLVAGDLTNIDIVADDIDSVVIAADNVADITNFADVYQGAKTSDPATRNDGGALQVGDLYFNTSSNNMRVYSSAGWVDAGTPIPLSIIAESFSGTGSQTAFTLSTAPAFPAALDVYISGVAQKLTADYTVSGTVLTFVSAPPSGTNNIYVKILSPYSGGVPDDGSVTPSKMANGGSEFGIRNRIINGSGLIDQRGLGAVSNTTDVLYSADRWALTGSVNGKFSVQKNAGSVTPPPGFDSYIGCTSLSSYNFSSQYFFVYQTIEGYNTADLGFGTANASNVTLSFWIRSSLTGLFGGSIGGTDRFYPFSFTINSANTWEYKTIVIPGATSGTWEKTTAGGIYVRFSLGCGTAYSDTANQWTSNNYKWAPTGATGIVATNGATLYFTGVQLEKGSVATPFEYRPYSQELALCQRYYEVMAVAYGSSAWPTALNVAFWKATKRAAPTIVSTPSVGTGGAYSVGLSTTTTSSVYQSIANSGITGGELSGSAEL